MAKIINLYSNVFIINYERLININLFNKSYFKKKIKRYLF